MQKRQVREAETVAKSVITIPATKSLYEPQDGDCGSIRKRRAAAYARVSTDHEEQQGSYKAQAEYYTEYIRNRSDWEFVAVYSDEGITGCNTKKREGFNRMVQDALSGKIDLIITKSVSRFARNTVDSLTTIRKLKEHKVECYFEKENIWTFDGRGELLLTIMSSLAQEESRSISQNCTWGQRKRFADGKASVPFKRFLGYDRGQDGSLVINEKQAETVRRIYGMFLQGRSPHAVAKALTKEEIPTPGGKQAWTSGTVRSILQNEKYKGDALLQKVYTVDFLTKKKKPNQGEVPQYYVEGSHPAIISPQLFDRVQEQLEKRLSQKKRESSTGVFSSRIICGSCGSWYGSKVWHSNDKYRRAVWQCNHKFDTQNTCRTPHLDTETIQKLFVRAANALYAAFGEKEKILEDYSEIAKRLYQASSLKPAQMAVITGLVQETQGPLVEFCEDDWYSLADSITVYSREDIRVLFKNGSEICVQAGREKNGR